MNHGLFFGLVSSQELLCSRNRLFQLEASVLIAAGVQPNLTICHIPDLPATRRRGTFYIPTRFRAALHWSVLGGWTVRTTIISPVRIEVTPGRILNPN